MNKIFTLIAALILTANTFAQTCTVTGFDVCTLANPVTNFTNAVKVSGNENANGAKYKFNNVTTIAAVSFDAIVTIDGSSNATLYDFDDDDAVNETGAIGSQAALFSPRIGTNADLTNAARRGWVQFTITFYTHYNGNTLPPVTALPVPVANLNFLHFDMDGYTIGSNGYFREIGYVKRPSGIVSDLINYGAAATELTSAGTVTENGNDWLLTYGSTTERDGISRCAQVIEKSVYALPQSSVTFRMGYDYKPAQPYANQAQGKPQRQYGSKFGCFSLPSAAPLPVSLLSFGLAYNNGVSTLTWTTSQEINLDKYQVLRSVDGVNFQPIGSVIAKGSLSLEKYSYADNNIPSGTTVVYYKLIMLDKDHKQQISNVVTAKITAVSNSKEMTIFPNPSSTNAQIRFKADKAALATIMVYDASGKVVLQQQSNVLSGNNSVAINNIVKLSDGMYTVKMISNDVTYSSKLIIWK